MRRSGIALALIVTSFAAWLALGAGAHAARRHAKLPSPTPTPHVVLSGEGAAIPVGADGDLHGLFGFVSSTVRRGVRVGFCSVGSDAAYAALLGTSAAGGACAGAPQPPDFVAVDVPLTAATSASLGSRGQVVQIPFLAHGVALVYDNPDVRARLRISVDTLCRIADGSIADWSQIPIDPANPSGLVFPHRPLHFVYRTDPNGETFALSNFLSATDPVGRRRACVRPGETFSLGTVFDPRDTSANPRPRFGVVPETSGPARSGFLGAAGDGGEVACVTGSPRACARGRSGGPGSIGYADAADAAAFARPPVGLATLYVVEEGIPHDYDPIADLPGVATSLETYVTDRVLAPFVANGRPPAELVPVPARPARAGCIATIPPNAYAFPAIGYPIVGITNLAFASAGNGERVEALRALATVANESKNFTTKRIRSIDPDGASTGTTGYSVLPLSTKNTKKQSGIPTVARCIGP